MQIDLSDERPISATKAKRKILKNIYKDITSIDGYNLSVCILMNILSLIVMSNILLILNEKKNSFFIAFPFNLFHLLIIKYSLYACEKEGEYVSFIYKLCRVILFRIIIFSISAIIVITTFYSYIIIGNLILLPSFLFILIICFFILNWLIYTTAKRNYNKRIGNKNLRKGSYFIFLTHAFSIIYIFLFFIVILNYNY